MLQERLNWATRGLDLAALGLTRSEPLFTGTPELSARLEVLEESPARLRLRFPLPGSPDAFGKLTGRPGPLGTGFLWLTIHRPHGLRELLRARATHPRSASLAEREWNLLCHLRARGVGTSEPLLVGARGAGPVARRSFLLLRAPEDAFPLPRWLRTDGHGPERERGLRALGAFLGRIARAGVVLPHFEPAHVWVAPSGSGACESEGPGPRKNRLPSLILSEVRGARLVAAGDAAARRRELAQRLASVLTAEELTRLEADVAAG